MSFSFHTWAAERCCPGIMCMYLSQRRCCACNTSRKRHFIKLQLLSFSLLVKIFIGPRCLWGPIYGFASLTDWLRDVWFNLTDVTLADEDTNSMLAADNARGKYTVYKIQNNGLKLWEIQKSGCTIANVVSKGFHGYRTWWGSSGPTLRNIASTCTAIWGKYTFYEIQKYRLNIEEIQKSGWAIDGHFPCLCSVIAIDCQ